MELKKPLTFEEQIEKLKSHDAFKEDAGTNAFVFFIKDWSEKEQLLGGNFK